MQNEKKQISDKIKSDIEQLKLNIQKAQNIGLEVELSIPTSFYKERIIDVSIFEKIIY